MSISQAMQIGISGLAANSSRVSNISNNIANANTDGYRRSFSQLVTTTTHHGLGSNATGVRAEDRTDVTRAGGLGATGVPTDLGVSGEGFFVVSKNIDDPNAANYMLTRAGSFRPDENGNLVNAAGYYLAGHAYGDDGTLGAVDLNTFTGMSTVNIEDQNIQGVASTEMSVKTNLPAQATGQATPGEPFVASAEYFTAIGEAQRLTLAWQPTATDNQWDLTVSDSETGPLGSVTVTFSDSGPTAGSPSGFSNVTNLATAPGNFTFDPATGVAGLTIDNGDTPQAIDLSFGAPGTATGITQFAGDFSGLSAEVDGAAAGTMVRSEFGENGDVYGIFDSGARKLLYSIPLANVNNPDGLVQVDGNAFTLSRSSGPLELARAAEGTTGTIVSGTLEGSNVEVSEELTDLIVAQRAYSSNAKIVTTSDQMLEETLSLKR